MKTSLQWFKAEFFKALGHPTRVHILEILRSGEHTVGDLHTQLGIEPSAVSQQLSVLRGKDIVEARKVGNSVYYSVRDPHVFQILDAARAIFNNHLNDLQAMAEEQNQEDAISTRSDLADTVGHHAAKEQ